jgi:eukaryotic-like serine/threonine-protein kinase
VEGFPQSARFDARRRLGSGAFGVVYEAYDRERQLLVALKTLRSAQSDALYLFKREFRSLADLNHPNLVALYELFAEGHDWFFTMELLRGRSFIDHAWDVPTASEVVTTDATRLTRSTRLNESRVEQGHHASQHQVAPSEPARRVDYDRLREMLLQLADGLTALHDSGKLHRDVKPRNVMVTTEGRVVLLDFGLVANVTASGADPLSVRVAGTPAYMAPEQAAARPLSAASDWYSVGAMLYETLTGRLPFHGSTLDVLSNKQTLDPPAVETLSPDVPADLSSLCRDLLARDPAIRARAARM